LNLQGDAVAIGIELAERALVDREFGIDEIATIRREPLRAIECSG
jgi:hypothetical protein